MSFLVDANVLCEATKPNANQNVVSWIEQHDSELHISVITLAEIEKGVHLLAAGRRKERLRAWFAELASAFRSRILPIDQKVCSEWSRLHAHHQLEGRVYPSFDSLIAATALSHRLVVVTRDSRDFPPEVPLFNPWQER